MFIHAEEVGRGVLEFNAYEQERAGYGSELNENYLTDWLASSNKDEYDEYFEETKYPISDDEYCKEIIGPIKDAVYEKSLRDIEDI